MGKVAEKLPLIDLPIGEHKRGLGSLEVHKAGQQCRLPLGAVDITAKVADCIASVTLKQTFRNSFADFLEAVYIFPLTGGCVVSEFELRVGTRVVKGKVEERAEARRQYTQALENGKRAALLEQERDDVFTMQVGNLPPNEEVTVLLTYSERLPFFEDGKTELRLPLVVPPRYIPGRPLERDSVGDGAAVDTDAIPDASRITPPLLATGLDPKVSLGIHVEIQMADQSAGDNMTDLGCSQHATRLAFADGTMQVELARNDECLNRDFVLRWRLSGKTVKSSLFVFKNEKGESYGMLSLVPPKRNGYLGSPRDVIFVIDRSGSMQGAKMTSAARACSILLQTLGPNDRYGILSFDDSNEWMQGKDGSCFFDADEAGIEAGNKCLRQITARGGTELESALMDAFRQISWRSGAEGRMPVIVILTDGQVGDESRVLKRIQKEIGDARLFTVGVDTAVNSGLLKRAASLGGGTCSLVQPGENLEAALAAIGREIGAPLITDLQIHDEGKTIVSGSQSPTRIADLFEGRASTVFLKLSGTASLRVAGRWTDGKPFSEKISAKSVQIPALAQLWAKAQIVELEDEFRSQSSQPFAMNLPSVNGIRQQIVELSIKHSILTRFTAYVAVDEAEVVNQHGTVRKIVQPVEKADSWEMLDDQAFAGAMGGMPQAAAGFGTLARFGAAPPPAQPGSLQSIRRKSSPGQQDSSWGAASSESFGGLSGGWGADPGSLPPAAGLPNSALGADASHGQGNVSPAPDGAPAPTPPPAAEAGDSGWQQILKKAAHDVGQQIIGGKGKPVLGARAEAAVPEPILALLAKLSETLEHCRQVIAGGQIPDFADLERLRKELLKCITENAVGIGLPLLQKFLRGAAVELVQSLKQTGIDAAGLQPLWDRHLKAFQDAYAETTSQRFNGGTGSGDKGNFWESTI